MARPDCSLSDRKLRDAFLRQDAFRAIARRENPPSGLQTPASGILRRLANRVFRIPMASVWALLNGLLLFAFLTLALACFELLVYVLYLTRGN